MGAGGGVLLASRHLLSASPTSKPAATALSTLQHPPPSFSPRVVLRVVVGLVVLIAVKELTKPTIRFALRPFLPQRGGMRPQQSLVDVRTKPTTKQPPQGARRRKGKEEETINPEWEMAPAEVLAKYLNYFAVGFAVVYPIPLLWAALGL